ncbi:MAG: helix-turn-helix transcriptional regulator [Planctomycetes bacterium]|nr:helix-turn-helix transcriptional regulator [Planctomycetota bacterium]
MQKQNDLRQRLRRLADRFSQAELARRTGVSKANVHRYLRAGRVPAEFLQALVAQLHVRPDWLLEGRGAMLRSEVSDHAADESAKLLELVVNLNAVSHERLGALSQDSTRQVRELADALARNEELRARLNQRVTPAFSKLIRRQQQHLNAAEYEQADELAPALAQLVRLCDHTELRVRHDMLDAVRLWWKGDLHRQSELHRRVLGQLMAAGKLRDRQFLRVTYNLCAGLYAAGRLAEAARIADAVQMLACPAEAEWDEDLLIRMPRAIFDAAEGRIASAMPAFILVDAGVSAALRPFARDAVLHACYQAGLRDFAEVLSQWSRGRGNDAMLLLLALWEDTLPALADALRLCSPDQPPVVAAMQEAAQAIAAGTLPPDIEDETLRGIERAILRAEAARRRQRKDATRLWKQAQASIARQSDITPPLLLLAMHHRHALELGAARTGDAAQHQAVRAMRAWLAQGNGALRKVCEAHGIGVVTAAAKTAANP